MKITVRELDAIIVGGGIQGATVALAAAQRGLRTLIVERDDIGAGASGNSYGIVHGGLRYLQTLDIPRWRRSRQAQAWYLKEFPTFVKPLRCVMPLYRWRFRSATAFRLAIQLEILLFRIFNLETPLPPTSMITTSALKNEFPALPGQNLTGAACWYDAEVSDMPGLIRAILNKAGMRPSDIITGSQAKELLLCGNEVRGLRIADKVSGETTELKCNVIINCAGSWAGAWQQNAQAPSAATLAFNLLLDRPMHGESALAQSVQPGKGRSYFIRSYAGGTYAGTYYRPAPGMIEPHATKQDVTDFLWELDQAFPGEDLLNAPVRQIMPGLLPDKDGSGIALSSKDNLLQGPKGFYTVLGGKFTTAPLLSQETIARIWPMHPSNHAATAEVARQHV